MRTQADIWAERFRKIQSADLSYLKDKHAGDRREAQRCIRQGKRPDCLYTRELIDDEPIVQRRHAAIYGECSFGCHESNRMKLNGETVCRWTREACQKETLSQLKKKYARLFG